jgi:hypothetical protein
MKQLVIGIVFDLSIRDLLPFFTSLRKCYSGDICIITTETNEQILSFYKRYNVYVHQISTKQHMYKARHYVTRELLETKYKNIDQVFFTDVRDIFFFGNIFSLSFKHDLNFFCEPCLIKDCDFNKNWISSSYDDTVTKQIEQFFIICNGTIFGTRQGFLEYEKALIKEIEYIGEKFVMDQPITNVLMYRDNAFNAELFYHSDGPIGTFHHDKDLTERNIFNNPVTVAHQYDRSKVLTKIVQRSLYFENFNLPNKDIYLKCDYCFAQDNQLVKFREYITQNNLGYGDNAHIFMWKELINHLPKMFNFLEIGVYKGLILCLIKLLANNANVYGISPLSAVGDKYTQYAEENYSFLIQQLHEKFNVSFSLDNIFKGISTDEKIKQQVKEAGLFDVIYIDGGHDFDTVVSDINFSKQICRLNGFIVMDDASSYKDFETLNVFQGFYDVSDAVQQVLETDSNYVERLCVGHNRIFQKVC